MGYSFAERINDTKVMIAGLEENIERWARRGITKEYVDEMRSLYEEIRLIDNTHEALKSRLKETTVRLWSKMDELNKKFQEVKTIIKLDMPKESWQSYGFTSQRRVNQSVKQTTAPASPEHTQG